ncbi:MAG: multiheme c-type cytochrome [Planctomycetota bacterium]
MTPIRTTVLLLAAGALLCTPLLSPRTARSSRDDHFTSSEQCAVCHSVAPGANAMRSPTGDDQSPYGLWQATMMANSFRDPYFRAQLRKETTVAGEAVQELCLRCHTPMVHHENVLAGKPAPRLADVDGDPFADDGVSCTVCHMMSAKGIGEATTFSGSLNFNDERRVFGPFADVATRPMQNLVRYTPTQGMHIRHAGLCGGCHTLHTEEHGVTFPEQTPYLEWRNSEFSDEDGRTETSRTCQECHMPAIGATRIARNPMGFDFNIPAREGYRAHAFVGGNAFMTEMIGAHREELDVLADRESIERIVAATRRQLGEATAKLAIEGVALEGGNVKFAVRIENLTGHKFPSAYPSRRAWLHVAVQDGENTIFECGDYDDGGRIVGVADEHSLPHVDVVRRAQDVAVYELLAADTEGKVTTFLTRMVQRKKDNRLLPRGFKADGPHVGDTAPVGTTGDADFVGGGDTVHFEVPVPTELQGRLQIVAHLYYQTIPPAWVEALRGIDAEECKRFVGWYDAADKSPERIAEDIWRQR